MRRGRKSTRVWSALGVVVTALGGAGCAADADMSAQAEVSAQVEALVGGAAGDAAPSDGLAGQSKYTLFEVGQVRPIALSADGRHLYATNTPDDRLEVFRVHPKGLKHERSISVGMRPVAVAEYKPGEVWVVNHLSDSISIVDTDRGIVKRTLLVGDEPRDIVFAGANRERAFITTAHRGQNSVIDPQLTTPGVGRADVWVFDGNHLGASMGGDPLTVVTLFADTPRALAVSPDGSKVYAAAFNSGNQTTVIDEGVSSPFSEFNTHGEPQPHTALMAKYVDGAWIDALGNDVSNLVLFNLPDEDVFTIDATAPVPESIDAPFAHVGTTLFNMAVNPQSGAVYVTNTDANNFTRFEGPGLDPSQNTTVRGNIAQSRITVIKDGNVTPIHLNKHIDYATCCGETGGDEAKRSLAMPRDLVVSSDGSTLYVTAFGSSKIGVFDTSALESDSFTPSEADHISLTGGGPSGIVLDEAQGRIYAMTRFNNAISIVDTHSKSEIGVVSMYSPEPDSVVGGRPFLYDAFRSSSHGDSACASCHIDGDMDHLAWDLGDPTALLPDMPGTAGNMVDAFLNPEGTTAFAFSVPRCEVVGPEDTCITPSETRFNSNKGPMTTQTLSGMDNHGPMHWRGDRTAGTASDPGAQPNDGMFDERAAFNAFNVAFPGLLGRDEELPQAAMDRFTDFMLQAMLPPNPIRNLDNSLTPQQAFGKSIYFGGPSGDRKTDIVRTCNGCHTLDPLGNAEYGVERPGFFGSDGRFTFENETQMFKVPHLRNAYQKVGMFGMAANTALPFAQNVRAPFRYQQHNGDQIRGFGYNHDGAVDSLFGFFNVSQFANLGPLGPFLAPGVSPNVGGFAPFIPPGTFPSDPAMLPPGFGFLALLNDPFFQQIDPETGYPVGILEQRAVEAFMLAYPSNMAPIVGQQVTLSRDSGADAEERLALLEARADVPAPLPECDLVGKTGVLGLEVGFLYDETSGRYQVSNGLSITKAQMRGLARVQSVTFTCVPPGDGVRTALDRDGDGYANLVERRFHSDPSDPSSVP